MTAPTFDAPMLQTVTRAPRSAGMAARATGSTPRILVLTLAAFLVINFARAHELIPVLLRLQLGKLIGVPLVLLAFQKLPRWQLRQALDTAPGRGMLFISLLMLVSVPLSIWPGNSVGYIKGVGLISFIMFVTTASVLVDRGAVLTVLRTEVVAVAADAARMFLPGAPVKLEDGIPRALFGYTYDPNDTAALFLVSIPIAVYLGNRKGTGRVVWYAVALVMVAAMVKTGSRGGLLGLGAMVAALALLAPPHQRARFLGAGFGAALAFLVFLQSSPALRARFATTFDSSQSDYNYTAVNGRVEIWKRGVHYMVTHPLTGVGVANFGVAELDIGSGLKQQHGITDRRMYTAHNSPIQIGAELGIPGLLAYLFVVGSAAVGLWRVRRRATAAFRAGREGADDIGALAAAVLMSLAGLFVAGQFLSLAYSPMTLFTFALSAAVIAGARFALSTPTTVAVAATDARIPGRRGGLGLQTVAPTGARPNAHAHAIG